MTDEPFDRILQQTLTDYRVSRSEKRVLQQILSELGATRQQRDFLRHRAFELARAELLGPQAHAVLNWLAAIVKVLDADVMPKAGPAEEPPEVFFSPGDRCLGAIRGLLRRATSAVDICVFTITDDRISDTIVETRDRGVAVRIIADNDKAEDFGSDIKRFERVGIAVKIDETEHHMHHKFAVFDRQTALTGSYNWTRSAALHNEENILVSHDLRIAGQYQQEFDRLWRQLS